MRILQLLLLISILILSPTIANAQTDWETQLISPSVDLWDLCMLDDGLHGWAVGSEGSGGEVFSTIYNTIDGENWDYQIFPVPGVSFSSIFFTTPDSGWVAGYGGVIFATTDGGNNWDAQASGTGRKLSDIHFINSAEGWITGGWGDGSDFLVLKTVDGGANWQNQSFGSDCYSTMSIYFASADNGWICGHDNNLDAHIHHTEDGGDNWIRQTVPAGAGPVYDIAFATSETGWATTSSLYHSPSGAVLYTTDGGDTWEIQTYTNLHYNYSLDVLSEQQVAVLAMQILSPANQQVWLSSDGGDNWSYYSPPVLSYSYGINWVGDDIWFACGYSQIMHSRDNGASWDWDNRVPTWKSLAWSDAQNGWLVAGTHVGTDGYCLRTVNGGESWSPDTEAPGGAQTCFVDADHGWMLWEGNSASVWRTADGGNSWTQHYIGSGNWIGGIFFINSDRGWAFGSNGTLRVTQNGGQTWTNQSSGVSDYIQTLFFIDEDEGWLAGGYGSGNGFIKHTVNGGGNWQGQTPAAADHFQDMHFIDNQRGWMLGFGGSIHATTNGGADWSIISTLYHDYTDEIFMLNESTGWIAINNSFSSAPGDDGRGFIYLTEDGGLTWDLEWSALWPMHGMYDISLQPQGNLWACGAHGTLLTAEITENVIEPATANQFVLSSSYPNPFNPATTIPYSLATVTQVDLVVFDMLGRPIATLVNEVQRAGEYQVTFDATGLSSGIYYYRLTAGDQSQTGKMLLVR